MSFISAQIFGLVSKDPEFHISKKGNKSLRLFIGVPLLKEVNGNKMYFVETLVTNPVIIKRLQSMGLAKGDYVVGFGEMIMDLYQGAVYPKFFVRGDLQRTYALDQKEALVEESLYEKTGEVKVCTEYKDTGEEDFNW